MNYKGTTSPFGFKYVGVRYVMYLRENGQEVASLDQQVSHKQFRMIRRYLMDQGLSTEAATSLTEHYLFAINAGIQNEQA